GAVLPRVPRRICSGPAHRRLRACVILSRGPTSGVSVCPCVLPGNAHCLLLQRYQDMPGVEHIPVVQIDLSVPLKVPGMPVSDQYVKLQEEREHRQRLEKDRRRRKKKDKDKRGKPRRHSSLHTESDEDIAPAQRVDIVTEEMPENALPSDEDDKDPNDPYRALDVDLDR
uniref:AP-3 complex subunit delta-1-like n=1 Tax=Panthera onca TaxID=9690 RepID=UPI0029531349